MADECFFIAPIGSDGSPERNRSDGILEFIVGRAAEELGLQAIRADQIAEPGLITLQVVHHLLNAKAAVADLTGLNPNVFYELAVRHTARLPVALIAEKGSILPFDIAQMRTIFFQHNDLRSADQCRKDIVAQLGEAITNGAVDSPIATSVDVQALQSGSAVERNIAELVTAVENIARMQRVSSELIEHLYVTERHGDRVLLATMRQFGSSLQEIESYVAQMDDPELTELVKRMKPLLGNFAERYVADRAARSADWRRLDANRARGDPAAARIEAARRYAVNLDAAATVAQDDFERAQLLAAEAPTAADPGQPSRLPPDEIPT